MKSFDELNEWYERQCNGDWEHSYGIVIETLDNPGWIVRVDLTGTSLEQRTFSEIAEGCGPDSHPQTTQWIHCRVHNSQFVGASDPSQLTRVVNIFVEWANV